MEGQWLEQLYVDPDAQGRGIGRALLDTARKASPGGLLLHVFTRNVRARRFYEAAAFALTEQSDGRRNEEREPDCTYAWSAAARSTNSGIQPPGGRVSDRPPTATTPHASRSQWSCSSTVLSTCSLLRVGSVAARQPPAAARWRLPRHREGVTPGARRSRVRPLYCVAPNLGSSRRSWSGPHRKVSCPALLAAMGEGPLWGQSDLATGGAEPAARASPLVGDGCERFGRNAPAVDATAVLGRSYTYLNLGSSPGRVGPAVAATSTRPARWPAGRQPFSSGLGTGHRQGSSEAQDVNTSCRSSAIGPEASRPRGTRCCGGVARKGSICIPSCGWTARCSTWARWEARKAMPSASTGSGRSSVRRGSPLTRC